MDKLARRLLALGLTARVGGLGGALGRFVPSLLVGALVSAGMGQYFLSVHKDGTRATVFYAIGVAAFLLTLVGQRFAVSRTSAPLRRQALPRISVQTVLPVVAAILCIVSIATVNVRGLEGLSLAAWALSLPAAILAALPWNHRLRAWVPAVPALLAAVPKREAAAVAILTLAGWLLRLWDLESYPSGVHGDEAGFGLIAKAILQGKGPNPFGTAFLDDPALFLYLEAPFLAVFGPTILGVRVFSALSGALTLLAFYVLMRRLFGVRPAILALALLAGSAVHMHFSRLALNVAQVPLLTCLTLYTLWRGQETHRRVWWLLAGIFGAMSVYFHFGGRLVPMIVALYFVYLLVTRPRAWRVWGEGAMVMLLGGIMTLAPMGVHLAGRTHSFTGHMTSRVIFNDWAYVSAAHKTTSFVEVLGAQFKANVLAFITGADASQFYTFTGSPLLTAVLGPLFVFGLALMLWWLRDARYALLGIWFWTVVIVGGALTIDSPQFHRLVPAVVPAIAGVALFLHWLIEKGPQLAGAIAGPALAVLTALVVLIAGYMDNANYFGPGAQARPWEQTSTQARYVAALGTEYRVYTLNTPFAYFEHEVTRFLASHVEGKSLHNPAESLPMAVPEDRDLVFLVYPHLGSYLPFLRSFYPGGEIEAVRGRGGQTVFTVFRVSRAEAGRWRGLLARYTGVERVEADGSALGGGAPSYPAQATWSGRIYAERAGRYQLQLDGTPAEVLIDGVSLGQRGSRDLVAGWHDLQIKGQLATPEARAALKWQQPGQPLVPVAAQWLDQRPMSGGLRGRVTGAAGQPIERRDQAIGFRNVGDLWGLRPPSTVRWEGTLNAPQPGRYRFGLVSTGEAEVQIDGRPVVMNSGANLDIRTAAGEVNLTPGARSIAIRYEWRGGVGMVELSWMPPGGELSIIPPAVLGPPQPQ